MTAQIGWTGDNGDPDNFFFLLGCPDGKPAGNNIPKWCNAEFNDLLVKARTIPDQAERAKLYQRMQEIEHEESAVAAPRPLDRLRGDPRQRDGLQAKPARNARVRRRRHPVRPVRALRP